VTRRARVYEHRSEPLLSQRLFVRRLLRHAVIAVGIIGASLAIGVAGYHWIAALPWLDALLNAAMILTGMGPVDHLTTPAAKLFASAYALFSGVAFVGMSAVLLAPAVHRLFHALHVDEDEPPTGNARRR